MSGLIVMNMKFPLVPIGALTPGCFHLTLCSGQNIWKHFPITVLVSGNSNNFFLKKQKLKNHLWRGRGEGGIVFTKYNVCFHDLI